MINPGDTPERADRSSRVFSFAQGFVQISQMTGDPPASLLALPRIFR